MPTGNGVRHAGGRGAGRRGAFLRALLLAVLAVAAATTGCSGPPGAGTATSGAAWVLPPEEVHYGVTYGEWSTRWWRWFFEVPRARHPFYDLSGVDGARSQGAPVWFLCGAPAGTGPVERTLQVPAGTALFFPVYADREDVSDCANPDLPLSITDLREILDARLAGVRDLVCEIDGARVLDARDVHDASRFRAQALGFDVWIPDDNVLADDCGGTPPGARILSPVAADGVYMMVAPMPSGGHTVHFRCTVERPGGGIEEHDVTYRIRVMP